MNKTYALVWNQAQGCWSAVGETARRRAKPGSAKRIAAALSLLGLTSLPAFALPTGENITAGKADIIRENDGKSMLVNQHTDKLITNWNDFSIAGNERVSFHQPGTTSIALNRVVGNNGSQIHGQLDANGKVFLVNPNGVLFGSGAQINVGGLVASTQNIADADFLAGNYRFSGNSTASIVNDGHVTAADGGSVALLGARVSNNGVIQAKMGRIALGAGNTFKVNFDGNDLLSLQVEGGAVDAQATNGGLLKADGGEVLMTARAAGNLLNAVVNNTGTIEAKGLASRAGKITLDGGTVKVAGTLDTSAAEAGAPAGSILTRGERVDVAADTHVDTRAGDTAGTWTIEAANAGVNGDRSIGADTLSRNLGTTNVALTNTQGDLTVGGPVAWNSDRALTLTSQKGNVDLQQTLSATGTNASLTVNAADKIRINDAVKLTGRNAHLELNSKNGHTLNNNAAVTLSGDNASFRSNGEDYKVLHTVADLRNVDANRGGRYVIGNTIDGANTSFRSIGGDQSFYGVFDGLGNTIERLRISNPVQSSVGLFSHNAGRIANLNLSDIVTTASGVPYWLTSVGTLAGSNSGTISNVTANNVTVSATGSAIIGGLVGSNYGGTIEHAKVTGRIDGDRYAQAIGGLVGENLTLLNKPPVSATIRDSQADVEINAAHNGPTGGLVGHNTGLIERSSSAGRINATGSNPMVGGLVGFNDGNGIIKQSSSSTSVTARNNAIAGGLVGLNLATIANSRASGKVSVGERSVAGGLAGVNLGEIDASTADGDVFAAASSTIGGLVGTNSGRILKSQANGNVTAGRNAVAGGFAGYNDGDIDESTATGNVVAGADSVVGGFAGRNGTAGRIHASHAQGNVRATGKSTLGGFAGSNDGFIETSLASGNVAGDNNSTAGGFAGTNAGTIEASDASGNVTAGNNSTAGGFAGINTGTLDSSNASGSVTVLNASTAGGLVGLNQGLIRTSSANGKVLAGQSSYAGGLAGRNSGTIADSRATGAVKAGDFSSAGGLVGSNEYGTIARSTASGDVEAGTQGKVGGLVGIMTGTVDQSHATGSAKGGDASYVGGLVGSNGGTITASSSSGTVSGGRYARLGGLVGGNFGRVSGSSSTSRVDVKAGYDQSYGALVGVNYGQVKP
ncbi:MULTISPECIES: GLUG motif-containing protein [unclassified Burkholderia]|uniref:GLUG motif-containing protein n=1 Tax=unclassified Burkholderia TaxID=2613784 RepID=UPI001E2BA923|nr:MULTISPECIES: GLUG motif-containing protein [unclassified Burkholderia]UEP30185.1 filamentous hemagglutinin N-terminal domain-containing protein [Burkholderia sp. B21-007]UEP44501.1 filamentous hemagglutinin N-terminal domain-containing protein [Burkholderia sp. B21-005]